MAKKYERAEIERLLSILKKTLTDSITLPEKGKRVEFEVEAKTTKEKFRISIYKGSVNRDKYDYNALLIIDSIPLLQLHINPSNRHQNPDGTIILGNHWHIYNEEYGRKIAFEAADVTSDDFVEVTLCFLERFNVIEKPQVFHQVTSFEES